MRSHIPWKFVLQQHSFWPFNLFRTYTSHQTTCARQSYWLYFIMIWMNFEYKEISIEDRKLAICAPGAISSHITESMGKFTWPIKQPASMFTTILAYFANLYNSSMFHMHCVDMNPCTCYRYDWIWQSTGLFSCMTHPYRWFGLQMTHPYRSAKPIRTVNSGELSTLGLNLKLLRNFSSMVFEQINSHMHRYEVTQTQIDCTARHR